MRDNRKGKQPTQQRAPKLCKSLRAAVDQHKCSREAPGTRLNHSRYTALKHIQERSQYTCPTCFGRGCDFQEAIERRLAPTAAHGFTRSVLSLALSSRAGLAHFAVFQGTVVLRNVTKCTKPWRASRVEGFHQMLNDTAAAFPLPDTELLFGCGDGMVSLPASVLKLTGTIDEDAHGPIPAFTAAPACDFSGNLPVPSFDYRSGISWRALDAKMAKYKALRTAIRWEDKRNTLFWRGRYSRWGGAGWGRGMGRGVGMMGHARVESGVTCELGYMGRDRMGCMMRQDDIWHPF